MRIDSNVLYRCSNDATPTHAAGPTELCWGHIGTKVLVFNLGRLEGYPYVHSTPFTAAMCD